MDLTWVSSEVSSATCGTGHGQFAIAAIGAGKLIAVFGGSVMTMEQFKHLPPELQHYPCQIQDDPELLLGPIRHEDIGNGEHFNHGCDPNAGFHGTQRNSMRPGSFDLPLPSAAGAAPIRHASH